MTDERDPEATDPLDDADLARSEVADTLAPNRLVVQRRAFPVGGDLREGKATHPVLVLIEAGVDEAVEIVRRHARHDGDVERMRELVREHDADEATRGAIRAELEGATAVLDVFPEGEARDALVELADRELARLD